VGMVFAAVFEKQKFTEKKRSGSRSTPREKNRGFVWSGEKSSVAVVDKGQRRAREGKESFGVNRISS